MTGSTLQLLLADDDTDDCLFFQDALQELEVAASLTVVGDGVELMEFLSTAGSPKPDVIYLDLNMPRKNGFECLLEIKGNEKLRWLPVIIYSTSLTPNMVDKTYQLGANFYIQKPAEYQALKIVILKSIRLISSIKAGKTPTENFVLQGI